MKAAAREKFPDRADRLPDAQTAVPAEVVESLGKQGSPRRAPLAALPLDREELSDEALQAVEEGIADHMAGRAHTSHETKRELGI